MTLYRVMVTFGNLDWRLPYARTLVYDDAVALRKTALSLGYRDAKVIPVEVPSNWRQDG